MHPHRSGRPRTASIIFPTATAFSLPRRPFPFFLPFRRRDTEIPGFPDRWRPSRVTGRSHRGVVATVLFPSPRGQRGGETSQRRRNPRRRVFPSGESFRLETQLSGWRVGEICEKQGSNAALALFCIMICMSLVSFHLLQASNQQTRNIPIISLFLHS